MSKKEIIDQTKIAFEFIQKLYFEASYLIKEMEGLLSEENPPFVICRPSGYNISNRSSNGLEAAFVNLWLMRKFSVAFGPKETTPTIQGVTKTPLLPDRKLIYVRVILDDKDITEPMVYSGVLYDFRKKTVEGKWPEKFEQVMTTIEYNEAHIFADPNTIDYENNNFGFKGRLSSMPLFDIDSSTALYDKIVKPAVKLFSEINPK